MKWLVIVETETAPANLFTIDSPDGLEGPRNAATMALDLCAASNPLGITVHPMGLGDSFEVVKRAPYLRAV